MKEFIDTNIVFRYLTGTPEEQFERARSLIDSGRVLTVTETVLLEAAYALEAHYGVDRQQVADVLIDLVHKENITPLGFPRALGSRSRRGDAARPGATLPRDKRQGSEGGSRD